MARRAATREPGMEENGALGFSEKRAYTKITEIQLVTVILDEATPCSFIILH